ncbi:tyrosine-type recombinase/integrase [Ruegeria sp. HKCCD5849]|uniref:tyrosine-type recombinase/integrase n=1 Tax=unclassified Ruegeria TaxID=2625375 RepID=UPI001490EDDE|nr:MULTISPECIES: site-specific integrase [unclassified Ruegeria]NOD46394.1 tyrosine-type recombinase/integrase [Ruegeria sp. HKCCD5849]NOD50306.1 tyrosine-type recombinase/integrase [Ruegeria sp. HKCCD5851]
MNKLKEALPASGRGSWRDTQTPGLELVGNQNGASWYLRHRINGKRVRDTLGRWPALDLSAARKAAKMTIEASAVKAAAGVDVVAERKAKKRKRSTLNVEAALCRYRSDRLDNLRSGAHAESTIRNVFDPVLKRSLGDLDTDDLRDVLKAKRKTAPATADTALRYARPFWRWIADERLGDNLLIDMKAPQTNKRERTLSLLELGKVVVALEDMDDVGALVARTLIASPGRSKEIAEMRIDEVEDDVWSLPHDRNKSKAVHRIPFNNYALEAIEAGRARNTGSPYVFEGRTGRTPFSGWSKMKDRLDEISGVNDWVWHDLRRTFCTVCADRGVDPIIADRCLNHVGSSTLSTVARIYQRSEFFDQRREIMAVWDQAIRDAAARVRAQNVVSLTG